MEFIAMVLFIIIIAAIWFLIEYWWVLLVAGGVFVATGIILWTVFKDELNRLKKDAVSAEIVSREPIVERVAENTGYTVGYSKYLSCHEHYRYKNVVTGYKVSFDVLFKDGKRETIVCNEGSKKYKVLINK
jgi:hypothetical protein